MAQTTRVGIYHLFMELPSGNDYISVCY